jgi:hypothetical protein
MRENAMEQFVVLGCLLFLAAMFVAAGNAGAQTAI